MADDDDGGRSGRTRAPAELDGIASPTPTRRVGGGKTLPRSLPRTTRGLASGPVVQRRAAGTPDAGDSRDVRAVAAEGVAGAGSPLPHREPIQDSFGSFDITGIEAHVGGDAGDAAAAIGAQAYTAGDRVAFQEAPDLHTAAHEAAHAIQQRQGVAPDGGVGRAGDSHEQHADAVADAVVAGRSAEGLLAGHTGDGGAASAVQRSDDSVDATGYIQSRYSTIHKQVWQAVKRIGMVRNGPYGHTLANDVYRDTLLHAIKYQSSAGVITESLQRFVAPESIEVMIDRSRGHDWDFKDPDNPKQKSVGPNSDTYVTPVAVEIANALARRHVEAVRRLFPQFLRLYMDTRGFETANHMDKGSLLIKQEQLVPIHPMETVVIEALCAAQAELPMDDVVAQHPELEKHFDDKYAKPQELPGGGHGYAVDDLAPQRPTEIKFRTEDGLFHWVEAIPTGDDHGKRTATEVAAALFEGAKVGPVGKGQATEEAYRLIPVPPLWGYHGRDVPHFRKEHRDELFKRWAQTSRDVEWPLDVASGCGAMLAILPPTQVDPIAELSAGGPQRALDHARDTADASDVAGKDEASVASRLKEDLTLVDDVDRAFEVVGVGATEIETVRARMTGLLAEATSTTSCMSDIAGAYALADKQAKVLGTIATGAAEIALKYARYGGTAMDAGIRALLDDCIEPFIGALVALEFPDVAGARAALGAQRVLTFDISVQEASLHHGNSMIDNALNAAPDPEFDAAGAKVQSDEFAYDLGEFRLRLAGDPAGSRKQVDETSKKIGDFEFDISLGDKLVRLNQIWEAIEDQDDFWESMGDNLEGKVLQAESKALRKKFLEQVKKPFDAAKKANDDDGKMKARANFKALLDEFRPFAKRVNSFLTDVAHHKKWTKIIVGIAIAVAAFALGQFEFAAILAEGGTLLEASVVAGVVTTTTSVALDKLILGHDPTVGSLITGFVGNIAIFGVVGKLAMAARAAGVSAEVAEATVGAARATEAGAEIGEGAAGGAGALAKAGKFVKDFTYEVVMAEAIMLVQTQAATLIDEQRMLTPKELRETLEMGVINVIGMKVGNFAFEESVASFKGMRAANEIDVAGLLNERAELHRLGQELNKAAGGKGKLKDGTPPREAAQALMDRWHAYFERETQVIDQLLELSRKHPRAFKAKAGEVAALREAGAAHETLARQFRAARALLGVEEVGPNLYRSDPAAMDAILAQHKSSGNELTSVSTDPHTGQRTLTIKTAEGETITLVEKLADVGERKPPAVSVGAARYFEEWLGKLDTATPELARTKQRLLEYYARDPEAALRLASERYGFAPGELPETDLLVTADAPKTTGAKGKGSPDHLTPERTDASRAYDQYAYNREGKPDVSTFTDDQVMKRGDFEAMYKAGFSYDPVAGTWLSSRTPAGGHAPVPGESGTNVIGNVHSEAVGHQLLRKLVAGEAEALRVVGIEPPPDFDPRRNEWALGRKGEQIVLIRGAKGEINWSDIPGVKDIAHSHPFFDPRTGEPRLLQGKDGSGTIDAADLLNSAKEGDLRIFLPSTGDLVFIAVRGKGHRLHTPYVHVGGGKIGNPTKPGMMADTVEIVIGEATPFKLMELNDTVVWKAEIQIWAGDQQLASQTMYQGFLDYGATFSGDAPSMKVDPSWKPIPADHPVLRATGPETTPMATGLDLGHVDSSTAGILHKTWALDPSNPKTGAALKSLSRNDADALAWLTTNASGGRVTRGFDKWLERFQDPNQRGSAMNEARLARRELDADPGALVDFDANGRAQFQSKTRTDVSADAIDSVKGVSGGASNKLDQFTFASEAEKQAAADRIKAEVQRVGEQAYMDAIKAGETPKVARKRAAAAANRELIAQKDKEGVAAARRAADDAIKTSAVFEMGNLDLDAGMQLVDYTSKSPTVGVRARELAGILPGMREADFLTFMNGDMAAHGATTSSAQIPTPTGVPGPATQTMVRWEYLDGTVIRYKPLGDAQRPGTPTFSIEVKKNPFLPDTGSADVAFKVDAGGNAVPRSAYEMKNPFSNYEQANAFETAVMDAVHFELQP